MLCVTQVFETLLAGIELTASRLFYYINLQYFHALISAKASETVCISTANAIHYNIRLEPIDLLISDCELMIR